MAHSNSVGEDKSDLLSFSKHFWYQSLCALCPSCLPLCLTFCVASLLVYTLLSLMSVFHTCLCFCLLGFLYLSFLSSSLFVFCHLNQFSVSIVLPSLSLSWYFSFCPQNNCQCFPIILCLRLVLPPSPYVWFWEKVEAHTWKLEMMKETSKPSRNCLYGNATTTL